MIARIEAWRRGSHSHSSLAFCERPAAHVRKELSAVAHEAVKSAVFACMQAQFGGKFASQGGERNIMSDIFLAAARDEFLIRFART